MVKSGNDGDARWNGEVLEISIFNKALTADEVLFLFNKGVSLTGILEESSIMLIEYSIRQNDPHPFNSSTTSLFRVLEKTFVSLKGCTILVKEITELAGKEYSAGQHLVRFDVSYLASGVYFYTIRAGKFTSTKKMISQK